jgi:hypothetical protein
MPTWVMRTGLVLLALPSAVIAAWGLLAPHGFYTDFPGAGRHWVSALPPYNEHLVTDYGSGFLALSVLVALAREGAARAVRPLLPYMNRIAGLLLLASGGYLFYYWARLRFGDTATVADDPIVSFGVRFSGDARNFAGGNGSLILVGAAVIVALAVFASLWHRRRRTVSTGLVRE